MTTRLKAGDPPLTIGGSGITSSDGVWEFVLTTSFLVVRKVADHSTFTFEQGGVLVGDTCKMQSNGDLVLTVSFWDSQTAGFKGAYLEVTTAGHAIIYDSGGSPIWDNGHLLYTGASALPNFGYASLLPWPVTGHGVFCGAAVSLLAALVHRRDKLSQGNRRRPDGRHST